MPIERLDRAAAPFGPGPAAELRLSPHKPLDARGFAVVIGATFVLLLVPLVPVLGTVILWVLLPFLMAALAMIWIALRTSAARQLAVSETLTLTAERVSLERREARGDVRRWEANPHWVTVSLHPDGGPVENYVTLKGGGREVEVGAFLSPDERLALRDEIEGLLRRVA